MEVTRFLLNVSIADVDPYEDYEVCPVCEKETQLIQETSGALTDWTQCGTCQHWFSPEVIFS